MPANPAPLIIPGNNSRTLAGKIAAALGTHVVNVTTKRFDDDEVKTRIEENIRGRDVVVVASAAGHPDEQEKETRLLLRAAGKRCGAQSVTLLLPYMWYGRSDDTWGERTEPALMDTIETLRPHCHNVIVADPHNGLMVREKFAEACHTTLVHFALPFAMQLKYLMDQGIISRENLMLAHADTGSTKRIAPTFRACVYNTLGMADRKPEQDDWPVGLKDRNKITGKSEHKGFSSDVAGKDVVVFEDMIASGGTAADLAKMVKEKGARSVILFATSGLFTVKRGTADITASVKRINASALDAVYITDTYNLDPVALDVQIAIDSSPVIDVIETGPYLAEIIRAMHARVDLDQPEMNSISAILTGTHPYHDRMTRASEMKPHASLLKLAAR